MTHRKLKARDFVGKTVAQVDVRAVNIIRFFFTDGSAVAIEVDHFGHDLWGMVACDECTDDRDPGSPTVQVAARATRRSRSR
jgi:hypothetical protein